MTGREAHLKELKAINALEDYFEGIRQIIDQMIDEFPLDNSQWMTHTDLKDKLMQLERSYKRTRLVKGEPK